MEPETAPGPTAPSGKIVCLACGSESSEFRTQCDACGSTYVREVTLPALDRRESAVTTRPFGMKAMRETLNHRFGHFVERKNATESTLPRTPVNIEELDGLAYLLRKAIRGLGMLLIALAIAGLFFTFLGLIGWMIGSLLIRGMQITNH